MSRIQEAEKLIDICVKVGKEMREDAGSRYCVCVYVREDEEKREREKKKEEEKGRIKEREKLGI